MKGIVGLRTQLISLIAGFNENIDTTESARYEDTAVISLTLAERPETATVQEVISHKTLW